MRTQSEIMHFLKSVTFKDEGFQLWRMKLGQWQDADSLELENESLNFQELWFAYIFQLLNVVDVSDIKMVGKQEIFPQFDHLNLFYLLKYLYTFCQIKLMQIID